MADTRVLREGLPADGEPNEETGGPVSGVGSGRQGFLVISMDTRSELGGAF